MLFITILAGLIFLITWSRERSDERWLEYLSSDEGLEGVLERLFFDKQIKERKPLNFTVSEFAIAVATKKIPKWSSFFLGKNLDIKHLGPVANSLLNKLKDKKIIRQVETPSIQTRFELIVEDTLLNNSSLS